MKKYIKIALSLILFLTPFITFAITTLPLNQGGTGHATSTIGDLLMGTTSISQYSRLPIGSSGKVLTSNGSNPVWSTLPASPCPQGVDYAIQIYAAGICYGSTNLLFDFSSILLGVSYNGNAPDSMLFLDDIGGNSNLLTRLNYNPAGTPYAFYNTDAGGRFHTGGSGYFGGNILSNLWVSSSEGNNPSDTSSSFAVINHTNNSEERLGIFESKNLDQRAEFQLTNTANGNNSNFISIMNHGSTYPNDYYTDDDAGASMFVLQGADASRLAFVGNNNQPIEFYMGGRVKVGKFDTTGLNVYGSTTISSLTAANCDLKATLSGGIYCGIDQNSGSANGSTTLLVGNGFLYTATSSDMLSVGSSTPTATLSVQGTTTQPTRSILAIASSSGIQVLTVSANQRVGVGTSSPAATFAIQGTSTFGSIDPFVIASSTGIQLMRMLPNGQLRIGSTTPDDTTGKVIIVDNRTATEERHMFMESKASNSRAEFVIANSNSGGSWTNNFFDIAVHGSTYGSDNYLGTAVSDAGLGLILGQGTNMQGMAIGRYNNNPVYFFNNNTVRMQIAAGGNVAIGGTSSALPTATSLFNVGNTAQFQVNSSGIVLAPAGTPAAPAYSFVADPNTGTANIVADTVSHIVGGLEKMRLTTTGLGVGSSTPGSTLVAQGTSTAPTIDELFVASSTGALHLRVKQSGQMEVGGLTPTIATSTGAGTNSGTASVTGNANGGVITVTTGTLPAGTAATIATITYPQACATDSAISLTPGDPDAAALSASGSVYMDGNTTTATMISGSTGLVGATTYIWNYQVICW